MSQTYTIHRVGFRQGLSWLPASAEMMRSGIRPLIAIAALWLLLSLIGFIPVFGQIVIVIITPLLTAGVLLAFDRLGEQRSPAPTTLFAGWHDPVRRISLLVLGLFMISGAMAAALVLFSWLGTQLGQEQMEVLLSQGSPEAMAEALSGVSIGGGLLLAALVMGLVLAGLYFSVALVMFGRAPALQAFITSIRAVLVNWVAFVGYLIALTAIVMGVGLILLLITSFLTLALGPPGAFVAQIFLLLGMMLFQIMLAGAQYLAFSQVFGWSPGLEDLAGPGPQRPV
jgi:hypothetical protein